MSLSSMTNVAVHRREDYAPKGTVPKTAEEMVRAASPATTPGNNVTNALAQLVTYIPTEVLTLYVSVTAALDRPGTETQPSEWVAF